MSLFLYRRTSFLIRTTSHQSISSILLKYLLLRRPLHLLLLGLKALLRRLKVIWIITRIDISIRIINIIILLLVGGGGRRVLLLFLYSWNRLFGCVVRLLSIIWGRFDWNWGFETRIKMFGFWDGKFPYTLTQGFRFVDGIFTFGDMSFCSLFVESSGAMRTLDITVSYGWRLRRGV